MILLTQDGKNLVNFDNVTYIKLNDEYDDKECKLIAYFVNGTSLVTATYKGEKQHMGMEVLDFLAYDYKGSASIKLPK
jgi:hypothetical protein